MDALTEALTVVEQSELAACESEIERGLEHFIAVGTALMRVKDKQLYRDTDETFSAYCLRRWKISRGYAYRLIAACEVAKEVLPFGDIKPTTEAQCRPLTKLATSDEKNEAWQEAVETAPADEEGQPIVTAQHVAEVVAKRVRGTKGNAATVEAEPVAKRPAVETDRVETLIGVRDEIVSSFASTPKRYDAVSALNKAIDFVRILQGS